MHRIMSLNFSGFHKSIWLLNHMYDNHIIIHNICMCWTLYMLHVCGKFPKFSVSLLFTPREATMTVPTEANPTASDSAGEWLRWVLVLSSFYSYNDVKNGPCDHICSDWFWGSAFEVLIWIVFVILIRCISGFQRMFFFAEQWNMW